MSAAAGLLASGIAVALAARLAAVKRALRAREGLDSRHVPAGLPGYSGKDAATPEATAGGALEAQNRFHSAFDFAAIGMAIVSPEGRWLQVNRAFCQIIGYSPEELLALTFQDVTHPDDLDAGLSSAHRVLSGEIEGYAMEKRYLHQQGHVVWVLLTVSLVRSGDGAPLHFISQMQDISARKAAEQAVRVSEERFQLVVTGTHDGIWDWDMVSGHCYYSPRYKELLGYADAEVEPSRAAFEEWLHPDDRDGTSAALHAHLHHRVPYSVEYRLRNKSGQYVWCHARG
jgi:PAS domain S-box-containing protein